MLGLAAKTETTIDVNERNRMSRVESRLDEIEMLYLIINQHIVHPFWIGLEDLGRWLHLVRVFKA